MKAVLISIKPKYCELIANGKKTVEVRKTRPNIDVPFKCYIYCTQAKNRNDYLNLNPFGYDLEEKSISELSINANGKVIGEFVCDRIVEFENDCDDLRFTETADLSCVGIEGLYYYLGAKEKGYGWHITDLVIYYEPKELGEFYQIGKSNIDYCTGCIYHETPACEFPCYSCNGDRKYLYRPPQSWQFVEKMESE